VRDKPTHIPNMHLIEIIDILGSAPAGNTEMDLSVVGFVGRRARLHPTRVWAEAMQLMPTGAKIVKNEAVGTRHRVELDYHGGTYIGVARTPELALCLAICRALNDQRFLMAFVDPDAEFDWSDPLKGFSDPPLAE
jgi:hypothetical protein